jgi:hypothetical protein
MKNLLISFALLPFISLAAYAQTRLGINAGSLGGSYSYFGNSAGNASTANAFYNSFFGAYSGQSTTTGDGNTAAGLNALRYNTTGSYNIAVGVNALRSNTVGMENVANGKDALYSNTTGNGNTATGYSSLNANTGGSDNTANGYTALPANTTGDRNVALGLQALYNNTTGSNNTANAGLYYNISGSYNCSFGTGSLCSRLGSYSSAFGYEALYVYAPSDCSDSYSSALGARAGTIDLPSCLGAPNTTSLGSGARVTASNQVRIGNSAVTSIGGQVAWSVLSDGRFKRDIKSNVAGLDFIKQLNPVSYTLDQNAFDKFLSTLGSILAQRAASRTAPRRQVGFIAQEVESVINRSDFVFSGVEKPQNERDPYTIRYSEFVVPLVKAVQELSATIDARTKQIARLKDALRKYQDDNFVNNNSASGGSLFQNTPNPFSSTTKISMEVPEAARAASLVIYNLEGKQLQNYEVKDRGTTSLDISGGEFNTGMYLYTLIVDGKVVDTKRLILTK